jgi:hypothetical protein
MVTMRRMMWAVGLAWVLSWIGLWREIFRSHHVTASLRLNPPKPPPWMPEPKPGLPLLLILGCAALSPIAFLIMLIVYRTRRPLAVH